MNRRSPYPVERTLLTTGLTEALMVAAGPLDNGSKRPILTSPMQCAIFGPLARWANPGEFLKANRNGWGSG